MLIPFTNANIIRGIELVNIAVINRVMKPKNRASNRETSITFMGIFLGLDEGKHII